MRFELLAGDAWVGQYSTRRAAMADAEMRAAKSGQRIQWSRQGPDGETVGRPEPEGSGPTFIVRRRDAGA